MIICRDKYHIPKTGSCDTNTKTNHDGQSDWLTQNLHATLVLTVHSFIQTIYYIHYMWACKDAGVSLPGLPQLPIMCIYTVQSLTEQLLIILPFGVIFMLWTVWPSLTGGYSVLHG